MNKHEFRQYLPGRDRASRVIGACALALVGFIVGTAAIERTVTRRFWHPYLGEQSKKLARIETIAPAIRTLFVGPSHLDNGIQPRIFDQALAGCGVSSFSFNAAVGDLRGPELRWYLGQLAKIASLRPGLVFLEPLINPSPPVERMFTTRVRYHFSWDAVQEGVRVRRAANLSFARKVQSVTIQLAGAAVHQLNLGVLADVLLPRCPACETEQMERGPLEERPSRRYDRGGAAEIGDPEQADSSRYEASVRALGGRRAVDEAGLRAEPRELNREEELYLERTFSQIRALGAKPVALFPPLSVGLLDHRSILRGIERRFPDVPVLSYLYSADLAPTSPLAQLFADDPSWLDDTHLTPRGAATFSRLLASDYCRLLHNETAPGGAVHVVH